MGSSPSGITIRPGLISFLWLIGIGEELANYSASQLVDGKIIGCRMFFRERDLKQALCRQKISKTDIVVTHRTGLVLRVIECRFGGAF